MPDNSTPSKLNDNEEPNEYHGAWKEMSDRVSRCQGLEVLDHWFDEHLEELEREFSGFTTRKSIRRDLRRK